MTKQPTIEKWLKTRCVGCGKCCTETIVPVTSADIRRLMRFTGKMAEEIVCFFGPQDVDWAEDDAGWIATRQGKRFLALRKTQERCQFLNDAKLCTVYDARPMTCRTFPLEIFLNEAKTKIETITLNRIVKSRYPKADKPLKSEAVALQQAKQEDDEDALFHQKIAQWNRKKNPTGLRDFLKFLKLAK